VQFHNLQALQGSINMSNELETQLKLKLDELNQYSTRRKLEYGIFSSQLDLLYNDIRDGKRKRRFLVQKNYRDQI
jgi:hypothetical protein